VPDLINLRDFRGVLYIAAIEKPDRSWSPLGAHVNGQDETAAFEREEDCQVFCNGWYERDGTLCQPIPLTAFDLANWADENDCRIKVFGYSEELNA
jgi:hypothetical protein